MHLMTEYIESDKMFDLIADNNLLLMALSRFDIPLGFGDETVAAVCGKSNVDCHTFFSCGQFYKREKAHASPPDLSVGPHGISEAGTFVFS